MDLEKALEFSKNAITKYGEKKAKIVGLKSKLECTKYCILEVKEKVVS